MDNGQTMEEVEILPELLFADKVLKTFCPDIYSKMVNTNDVDVRMAQTCFTRAAMNSSECTLHRDFGLGIDVLLYTGDFRKGELCVPQLGIKVYLKKGDIIIMDSRLFHEVQRAYRE